MSSKNLESKKVPLLKNDSGTGRQRFRSSIQNRIFSLLHVKENSLFTFTYHPKHTERKHKSATYIQFSYLTSRLIGNQGTKKAKSDK